MPTELNFKDAVIFALGVFLTLDGLILMFAIF